MKVLSALILFFILSPVLAQQNKANTIKVRKEYKDLQANVSGIQPGRIGTSQLAGFEEVLVNDTAYKVVSFVIYFPSTTNGLERKVIHKGSLIYPEVKTAIMRLKSKSLIEIQELVIEDINRENRTLAPFTYRVYEDFEN